MGIFITQRSRYRRVMPHPLSRGGITILVGIFLALNLAEGIPLVSEEAGAHHLEDLQERQSHAPKLAQEKTRLQHDVEIHERILHELEKRENNGRAGAAGKQAVKVRKARKVKKADKKPTPKARSHQQQLMEARGKHAKVNKAMKVVEGVSKAKAKKKTLAKGKIPTKGANKA